MIQISSVADYSVVSVVRAQGASSLAIARPPERLGLDTEQVALRLVDVSLDEAAADPFVNSIKVRGDVNSAHFVPVLDAGKDGPLLYLAMPLCERGSLEDAATDMSLEQVIDAMVSAAKGVADLHRHRLVHNNISPAAVLLSADAAFIGRLGGALVDDEIDLSHVDAAAPDIEAAEFAAPDLVAGRIAPSPLTDVYALAATAHWALSGTGLYGDLPSTPVPLVRRLLQHRPRMSERIPPGVARVLEQALNATAGDQSTTAEWFAAELGAV